MTDRDETGATTREEQAEDRAGNGVAVPDDPSAEAAQEGVQTAFEVAPQE